MATKLEGGRATKKSLFCGILYVSLSLSISLSVSVCLSVCLSVGLFLSLSSSLLSNLVSNHDAEVSGDLPLQLQRHSTNQDRIFKEGTLYIVIFYTQNLLISYKNIFRVLYDSAVWFLYRHKRGGG